MQYELKIIDVKYGTVLVKNCKLRLEDIKIFLGCDIQPFDQWNGIRSQGTRGSHGQLTRTRKTKNVRSVKMQGCRQINRSQMLMMNFAIDQSTCT